MNSTGKHRLLKRSAAVSLCVAAAFACSPPSDEPDGGGQTDAFQEKMEKLAGLEKQIVEALDNGCWFHPDGLTSGLHARIVPFRDNGFKTHAFSMTVPYDLMICQDAGVYGQPAVNGDGSTWKVNNVETGIPVSAQTGLSSLVPVCAWYDPSAFSVVLNNGRILHFPSGPARLFDTFNLMPRYNPALDRPADRTSNVRGDVVTFSMSSEISGSTFVPSFDITCRSITVDGRTQVSGETPQDFSKDVLYKVELYNGAVYPVTVRLRKIPPFPVVHITTEGGARIVSKEDYVNGTVTFEDRGGVYSDVKELTAPMRIRGRGQTTWNMPKKPYRIKLDEKSKVFGVASSKDWVLLANYADKTLLRNVVAMKLSEIVGMSWTPAMYPVNVFLNGTPLGMYTFSEHKKIARHRVDITPVTPGDNSGEALTGGYYLEIEQNDAVAYDWTASYQVPLVFKEPEREELTHEQRVYVRNYFKDFEAALDSDSFTDPETGYRAFIDVDSFIADYLVQEITKNIDGNLRKSTFLTKERNRKLKMYHVWDFDLALGNCNYLNVEFTATNGPEGWFVKTQGRTDQGRGKSWYKRMFEDPAFVAEVKAKWNEIKPRLDGIPDFIEEEYESVKEQADANFVIWPILNTYVWPNLYAAGTYRQHVDFMKNYYVQRIAWLDRNINAL